MLRVEERSPSRNDETGHVPACRKVKSQFSFIHNVFPASVARHGLSRFARLKVALREKFKSLKKTISEFVTIDLDQHW